MKPAGVGENRPVPAHEAMQAAVRRDHFQTRPQPEMESVAEHDLRADVFEIGRAHRLHRAISADRHEGGRIQHAVREGDTGAAGWAVGSQ